MHAPATTARRMAHDTPMLAILGGLGAAFLWSISTITSARAGRIVGPTSAVAWAMFFGLLIDLPFVVAAGEPPAIGPEALTYLVVSGIANVIGLSFAFRAVQLGKIGIATAVCSTEGAVAALISFASGEPISPAAAATLAVIVSGVVLVALVADDAPAEAEAEAGALGAGRRRHLDPADGPRAVLYAGLAALAFGVGLFTTGEVGKLLPLAWAILPARVAGTLLLFVPLLLTSRLRLTRRALPLLVAIGFCEIAGTASFTIGAGESVAVAAVLASQFAALAAILAFFVFRERLTGRQRLGVVAVALGVALLSLLRA